MKTLFLPPTGLLKICSFLLFCGACGEVRVNQRSNQKIGGIDSIADEEITVRVLPVFYGQTRGNQFSLQASLVGDPKSIEVYNETTQSQLSVRNPKIDGEDVRFSLSGPIEYGTNVLLIQTEKQKDLRTKLIRADFTFFGISTVSPTDNSKTIETWLNPFTSDSLGHGKGEIGFGFNNVVH